VLIAVESCGEKYLSEVDVFTHYCTRFRNVWTIFTRRRYTSVVYAVVMCLSLCLSQVSIVSKQLDRSAGFDMGASFCVS